MELKREKIEALLYGGSKTPRFTQDTPILPDVWIAYAAEPSHPRELILTPYQDPTGRHAVTPASPSPARGLRSRQTPRSFSSG